MKFAPGPYRGPQRRNPPLIDGGGPKNRKDARLVELMMAAENCSDQENARLIIEEAYMLGHASGAQMMMEERS